MRRQARPRTQFEGRGGAYTSDALTEITRHFKQTGRMIIIPLTVQEILDEQFAHKLA